MTGIGSTSYAQSVEVMHYGNVPHISGGIGLGERQALEMVGKKYNLKLVFAIQKGNYLADVNVLITNSGGDKVMDAVSGGPWFYADLPAGTYHVSATASGKTIQKTVRLRSGVRTRLNFIWPNG